MIEDVRKNAYENPFDVVKKAVVLVSGGMDSCVCLHHVVKELGAENVKALSAYYGQRSDCELKRAEENCKKLGVERFEMNLSPIFSFNKNYSSYIKGSDRDIEDGSYAEILQKKHDEGKVAISDEYIPNRNSLLLNVVCSLGLQMFNNEKFAIVSGIHCDDAVKASGSAVAAYPDAVAAGSLIYMADGTAKKIEDIEVGDIVWGFNENSNKIERSLVLNKINQGKRPVYQCGPAKVSENHLMWLQGNSKKFMRFSDMKRSDATYKAWFWDHSINEDNNPESFKKGYLRGFIEGDGHIGDAYNYITIYQNRKDVLEEFLSLANTPEIIIHEAKNKNIFSANICSQGKNLLSSTEDDESLDYALGYINGMIIAEGCYVTNSGMGFIEVEQSIDVNSEKIEKFEKFLKRANIYFTSFHRKKDNCKAFKFSKAFRLPLKYGASKLNDLRTQMEKHLNVKSLKAIKISGIKKAEFLGEMDCYDLTTSSGSFISDGLLVHNCTLEFANSINTTLQEATAGVCYVYTPLANMTKTEVAKFGVKNGMTKADFKNTWSCYRGDTEEHHHKPCGRCCTCRDREKAEINGVGFTLEDILDEYDLTREEAIEIYNQSKLN